MSRRAVFIALTIVLMMGAGWFGLWMVASASMACAPCNCTYSLFHEVPRCRQPWIALIGACVAGVGAVCCLVFAIRAKPGAANVT
jgi:hypothetical protein